MNKIEITVRVNLINLKLIFLKNKKIYYSRLIALVFLVEKINFAHWFFKKKNKLFLLIKKKRKKKRHGDSGAWLHYLLNSRAMLHC